MKMNQGIKAINFGPIAPALAAVKAELQAQQLPVPLYAADYKRALGTTGKMWRAAMTILFAKLAQAEPTVLSKQVISGAAAIEILHLATLIHDDVLDEAPIRRHQPTLQMHHGNHAAIYLGDELLARYFRLVTEIAPDIAFAQYHARVMQRILTGELQQAADAYSLTADVSDYIATVRGKTGALFGLAACTGEWLATGTAPTNQYATIFGENMGIAFQILDDIDDFRLRQDSGKPKLSDLSSGVYTLPLRIGMQGYPTLTSLLRNQAPVRDILAFLQGHPDIQNETVRVAESFLATAQEALTALPDQPARKPLVQITEYLATTLQSAHI
jgi:heptaprenyl diphosphate synthase